MFRFDGNLLASWLGFLFIVGIAELLMLSFTEASLLVSTLLVSTFAHNSSLFPFSLESADDIVALVGLLL